MRRIPLVLVLVGAIGATARRVPLPNLHGEALTFDPTRGRVVLFGGSAESGWFSGTWELDGEWRKTIDSAKSPTIRAGHSMAYDPGGRRVMLFGGQIGPPRTRLCDTWVLQASTWTRFPAASCVTDRVVNTSLVFDARHSRMLLLEGPAIANDTTRPLRIWSRSGDNWTLVDSTGPRRVGFSAVAYDEARSTLVVPVLFGGPDAGVWEWNGERWRHVAATEPGTRQTYGLTYDARRGRVMVFGGQRSTRGPYLNDLWAWTGERWTEIATDSAPPPRGGGWLIADANGRLLVFGGYNESPLKDLWALDGNRWRRIE